VDELGGDSPGRGSQPAPGSRLERKAELGRPSSKVWEETVRASRLRTPLVSALVAAAGLQLSEQTSSQAPQTDRIRVGVELITTTATVRDARGQFIASLRPDEFEIYEDGVKQSLVTFSLTQGGRTFSRGETPQPSPGIIMPAARPPAAGEGRVFLIFIDDSHLEPGQTARVRDLFRRIGRRLVHQGDLFGILSSGTSSIAVNMTYDRRRLDEAERKIMGTGLTPRDILETPTGGDGPAEVRHRAHVAFSTAYDIVNQLAEIRDRRKALIYISNGYDLNPFAEAREQRAADRTGDETVDPFAKQTAFSEADLVSQLSELTRAASRANVAIFTIDPRGLTAGSDISQPIDPVVYQRHVSKTQDTLRVLAEQTGGRAIVNRNDFDKGLDLIDAETSDYYVLGYYSSNPDRTKRRRTIEIKVTRPGARVQHRTEYVLKPQR
jgi:VWFA-related protein